MDRQGKKRYKGNKNLRPTENLVWDMLIVFHMHSVLWIHLNWYIGICKFIVDVFPIPFWSGNPILSQQSVCSQENYPMPFARHLVDMLEDMKSTCRGAPVVPEQVPDALVTFTQWPQVCQTDWQFVDFDELYTYLRGNKNLRIPPKWRGVIPNRLGENPWGIPGIPMAPDMYIYAFRNIQTPDIEKHRVSDYIPTYFFGKNIHLKKKVRVGDSEL